MLAEKLQSKENLKSIVPEIKIDWFLNAGQEALSELVPRGLISVEVRRRLEKYFETVTKLSPRSEPVLCHGDFRTEDIMLDKATPIVIDWEDAFMGSTLTDHLYWLTFFENRRHYSENIFDLTSMEKDMQIAIMLLIITLKNYTSFLSGQYMHNALSFDDRLLEIMALA